MQYSITINQVKALEWGLSAQQAMMFAFVYECPAWARPIQTDSGVFFALSKGKIIEELPLLTDKPDTVYRLLKQLAVSGLIELSSTASITLVRLTEQGQQWNKKIDGAEKYQSRVGKISEVGNKSEHGKISDLPRKNIRAGSEKNPREVGKKSEPGSEKNPTNHVTSNQVTSQDTSQSLTASVEASPVVILASEPSATVHDLATGKRSPDETQQACRLTWNAYSAAYAQRYGTLPVRNAKINGQVRQLVQRLGATEAPQVAAYYVGINDAFYVRKAHELGLLVAGAEGIRTQWATGTQINSVTARQIENTQANVSAAEQAKAMISAGGIHNAFL